MLGLFGKQRAYWAAPLFVAMAFLSLIANNAVVIDPWESQAHHTELTVQDFDEQDTDSENTSPSDPEVRCHLTFACLTFIVANDVLRLFHLISRHFHSQSNFLGDGLPVPGLLRPPSLSKSV